MKEIYAVIRINKMQATKKALEAAGFPAMTAYTYRVMGRGKQMGLRPDELSFPETSKEKIKEILAKEGKHAMRYVPKRLLYLVVEDADVNKVVDTIIKTNQSGHHGDGRIFVCPVQETIQIRTGERITETKPN